MELPPRIIWALPAAYLLLLVPGRIGWLVSPLPSFALGPGQVTVGVVAVLALMALQLWIVLPQVQSPPAWLLAGQALLTFGPYAVLGSAWGPIAGLLASAVLLMLAAPISWLLFALVVLADTAMGVLVPPESALSVSRGVFHFLADLTVGLSLFALTRLAELVGRVRAAGEELAALEVARDRLLLARTLRAKLGGALSAIIASGRRELHRLRPAATGRAGAELAEIGELARQGLADARAIADANRTLDLTAEHLPATPTPAAGQPREPTAIVPRLAWWMLLATTLTYSGLVINNMAQGGDGVVPPTSGFDWAVVLVALPVAVGLQLYHGAPRLDGSTPRAWPWTLASHLLVTFALVGVLGTHAVAPAILALGAGLVRIRPPWSWVLLGTGTLVVAVPPTPLYPGLGGHLYLGASVLWGSLAVYAFCRIPDVTRLLHQTRHELAQAAVVRERLRVARDVHDLLGFRLSAINLKADLAAGLTGDDPATARTHLHELVQTAEDALGEVRAITDAPADLALREEAAAARSLLNTAGVEATLDLPTATLPAGVDTVLATVVREAVTNVIRHAAAHTCAITITDDDGVVTLRVTNDGATPRTAPPVPAGRAGTGLVNLTTRCEAAGGSLTADTYDDTFTVLAEIPTDNLAPTG